jgi:hypothetical protein
MAPLGVDTGPGLVPGLVFSITTATTSRKDTEFMPNGLLFMQR